MSVRPWLLLMAMAPSWTLHAPRYVRRRRITALTAADAGLTPALRELKASLCEQLRMDDRVWPGTMGPAARATVAALERERPITEESVRELFERDGEYNVLSCDPLVVAFEYNEANVVRGGFLARSTRLGTVEPRIEIKWRSDEILPVELNGTVVRNGDGLEVLLTDGAVRAPTSGEIQDMMDAQGALRGRAEGAIARHGGFGAALELAYLDADLTILRARAGCPQCADGTLVVLSRADPAAFEESWFKYARTRTYYDALGREKKMDLPY